MSGGLIIMRFPVVSRGCIHFLHMKVNGRALNITKQLSSNIVDQKRAVGSSTAHARTVIGLISGFRKWCSDKSRCRANTPRRIDLIFMDNRKMLHQYAYSHSFSAFAKVISVIIITSLLKVIWEEGRVAALSHTYAVKSSLVTNGAPQIRPQKYPFPWTDPQTPLPASSLDPSDL